MPPGNFEILHALKCVLGAPEAPFRACTIGVGSKCRGYAAPREARPKKCEVILPRYARWKIFSKCAPLDCLFSKV